MATSKRKSRATKKSTAKKPTAKKSTARKSTARKSTARKKPTKKTTAKKTTAKKTAVRKSAPKKRSNKKAATKAKSKPKKTTRARKRVMKKSPKTTVASRGKWASLWSLVIVLVGAAALGSLLMNPQVRDSIQGNILAQLSGEEEAPMVETTAATEAAGVLLSYQVGGDNENKLSDIFRTVFPDIALEEVSYQSERGQTLMSELGVTELPGIFFEKAAFEGQTLSEVVQDLFELRGDYYALNVSLVNPSYQVYLGGEPSTEGAVVLGEQEAPITVYVYSDPRCQHCRVNERNNQREFNTLIDEGLLRMVFMDLPQDNEGTFHATALNCLYQEQGDADAYLELRDKIYRRANLTKAYTTRELRRLGVNYDRACDEVEYRRLFRERKRTADREGITGIPALYIGQTGGSEYLRITGSQDYSVYQKVFDQILGEEQAVPAEEENTEGSGDAMAG